MKLLDFGLVQLQDGFLPEAKGSLEPAPPAAAAEEDGELRLTRAGHILGTPAYMSPEQGSEETADARSDIYSVGAVAYFLLTGRPPFVHPTLAQMVEAHKQEPPPPLPDEIDAGLAAVVMRCLKKAPDGRFQTVSELLQALGSCAAATTWAEEQAAAWWRERPAAADPAAADSQAARPEGTAPSSELDVSSARTSDLHRPTT